MQEKPDAFAASAMLHFPFESNRHASSIFMAVTCGFEKRFIEVGKTEHYLVSVPTEYLAFYSEGYEKWIVEPGDFELHVGASCGDIRLKGRIKI